MNQEHQVIMDATAPDDLPPWKHLENTVRKWVALRLMQEQLDLYNEMRDKSMT
jgi:hypothetical protein